MKTKYTFEIRIETGNAAFDGASGGDMFGELSRILGEISSGMASGFVPEKLRDINGNPVGTVRFVEVAE